MGFIEGPLMQTYRIIHNANKQDHPSFSYYLTFKFSSALTRGIFYDQQSALSALLIYDDEITTQLTMEKGYCCVNILYSTYLLLRMFCVELKLMQSVTLSLTSSKISYKVANLEMYS